MDASQPMSSSRNIDVERPLFGLDVGPITELHHIFLTPSPDRILKVMTVFKKLAEARLPDFVTAE